MVGHTIGALSTMHYIAAVIIAWLDASWYDVYIIYGVVL